MDIVISVFAFGLAFVALQTEVTPLWFDWPFVGLVLSLAFAHRDLANDKWCNALRKRLAGERPQSPYRALMIPLLRRITNWHRPIVKSEKSHWSDFHAPDVTRATRTAYAWFGWTLLDFALLWAVVYPVILLLLQWAILGEGRMGALGTTRRDYGRIDSIASDTQP